MSTKEHFEIKADQAEVNAAFGDFMRVFEEFKETNDSRLVDLERRSVVDVLTTEKLERIDRILDEQRRKVDDLALKASRPGLPRENTEPTSAAINRHRTAFEAYIRKGGGWRDATCRTEGALRPD